MVQWAQSDVVSYLVWWDWCPGTRMCLQGRALGGKLAFSKPIFHQYWRFHFIRIIIEKVTKNKLWLDCDHSVVTPRLWGHLSIDS